MGQNQNTDNKYTINYKEEAREVSPWIKHLSCKYEYQSLDSLAPTKNVGAVVENHL